MTKQKEKRIYMAPALTTVSFKMELGFASSDSFQVLGFGSLDGNEQFYGDQSLEDRQQGGTWGGNDGWF